MKVLMAIISIILLTIGGCTFYSGKSLLDDITCVEVDSFLVGFTMYHPNPNQYTRKASPFIHLRQYDITVTDSILLEKYRDSLCRLIMYSKNSNKVSREQWVESLKSDAREIREIEKRDSVYAPGGGMLLYLSNGEVLGFGRNLISISRIDGTYLGLPLSKGAFSYATGVYHNDSTLNNFIFDFCNRIIADKNRELEGSENIIGKMRLDIVGDTVNATPIPLLKYRY